MIASDTHVRSAHDRVVLMSIKPCYWARILDGSKRFELRRRLPHLTCGALVVVYASAPEKALVGYFYVERVVSARPRAFWREHSDALEHRMA
jgi:predicted transcriptional regulator